MLSIITINKDNVVGLQKTIASLKQLKMRDFHWVFIDSNSSDASLAMANTVPPPANIVHSNAFYSEVNPTGLANGIGVERANVPCPALFGTFSFEPTMAEIRNNRKNIALTSYYEGGRNSPRGVFPQ